VHRSTKVAFAAAICSLAVPAAADAATKTVSMGTPTTSAKAIQKLASDANAFFPSSLSVHVGDRVKFVPAGFHTVDLPAKGGKPVPLVSPTGQKLSEADAAGSPFWFAGQDQLSFTPSLAQGLYGKTVSYDGTKGIDSGLPLAPKPKPFTVTFKKAGSYTYLCDLHPGMAGTVKVLAKGKPVPSATSDANRVKLQAAAALKAARALAKTTAAGNTVSVGAADRATGVETFAFFPSALTVPTGTTVTFQMAKGSREAHTATTGPGDPEKEATSYLGTLAGSLQSPVFAGAAIYPSDTPGTPAALTPTSHGNGFWNSGFMDNEKASPQPAANAVKFSAPGTYTFYCLIHPFMKGTVTVQ
jgi:plastocyanin